ncbi:MAG: alanine dehydrogenase, partial [Pseudomonadota bacterium]
MRIGCPTEIKTREYRVGMTPATCREAIAHGHAVVVQAGAGEGAGFSDALYTAAGATLVEDADEVFATADLIV